MKWEEQAGAGSVHAEEQFAGRGEVSGGQVENRMGLVVVEGVAVPAALAPSFSDPKKRPFSYTKPLPPSADRPRASHIAIPKVLPFLRAQQEQQQLEPEPPTMPSNIQYNTPMPIYSRETAEEQYKQQFGTGPEVSIGATDKHFDPQKSETLKAINDENGVEFGRNFFEKVAQAEAPHIPISQEPSWTETARRKAERARSATPSAYTTYQPPPSYHTPSYATAHGTSIASQRQNQEKNRGYEFGGLDFVDKSRIPQDSYGYYVELGKKSEERKHNPGYEMGGMDFRKGAVSTHGPYTGYGPAPPRLQPKYDVSHNKHHEMNIEAAHNVNRVSADILIGDTISNQKLPKEEYGDRGQFGTSFAPTGGFRREHRTTQRRTEEPRSTTFSVSARKDYSSQGNAGGYSQAGYRSQGRAHSAAPVDRYQWNESSDKEVTVETLLNDNALVPRKRSVTPDWHTHSLDKHNRWINRSDPRLSRPQIYTDEPNWSRTVSQRRSAWESQARNTDARLQMPASTKVPAQQPPYWYNRANQTHNVWQGAADRQTTFGAESSHSEYNNKQYEERGDRSDSYTSHAKYGEKTGERQSSNTYQQQQQHHHHHHHHHQEPAHHESSFTSVQRSQFINDRQVPVTQSTYTSYNAVPELTPVHGSNLHTSNQRSDTWQSQSAPLAVQDYRSSSSHYEKREKSSERVTSQPVSTTGYDLQKSSFQQSSHQQSSTPRTVTTTVTRGSGGDFDRAAEMAEILPRGSVANTHANTQGNYLDKEGRNVDYKRELVTSVDPHRECSLLKEEEKRVVESPLEPGIISRHVTTKYYKKKTVTDTTTTTNTAQ